MKKIQLTIAACFTIAISAYAQHGQQQVITLTSTDHASAVDQSAALGTVEGNQLVSLDSYDVMNTLQEKEALKNKQHINQLPDAAKGHETLPHKIYDERPMTPSPTPANTVK